MKVSSVPRSWIFAVKFCVSAGLVSWIVQGVDFEQVGTVLADANVPLLFFSFLLFFLGYFLTAIRWRLLMSAHGFQPPLLVLVQSFMVGIFFNNLLPSTIGGDLSRMFDVWRIVRNKIAAVSIVLVDRFIGVLALILWAGLAVLVSPEIRGLSQVTVPITVVLGVAMGIAALVFGRPRQVMLALIEWLNEVCCSGPAVLRKPLRKVLEASGPYYDHNRVLLRAVVVSLLLQLNVIVHFWLLAMALNVDVSFFQLCAVIPCALMIMMLPISVNAIGVREVVFVYFLGLFGVSSESAVVFAWIAFLFVILQGMLGGLIFAIRRTPPDLSRH